LHLKERVIAGPQDRIIVIGYVPFLLQSSKLVGNGSEIGHDQRVFANKWKGTRIQDSIRCSFHGFVIKSPAETGPQFCSIPVRHRFANQQMEKGIISRGDSSPKAGLFWIFSLFVRELKCLLEEIVMKSHSYAH
jgi:hypothetical protein